MIVNIPTKLASFSDVWSPRDVALLLLLVTTALGCNDKNKLSQFESDWFKVRPDRATLLNVTPTILELAPEIESRAHFQAFRRVLGTPTDEYSREDYDTILAISNDLGHVVVMPPDIFEECATIHWHDIGLFLSQWPSRYEEIPRAELEIAAENYEEWIKSVLNQSVVTVQQAVEADDPTTVFRGWTKSLWGTLSRGCTIYDLDAFTVIVYHGYEPKEGEAKQMHVDFIDDTTLHRIVIESDSWQNAELLAKYAIAGYGYAPE